MSTVRLLRSPRRWVDASLVATVGFSLALVREQPIQLTDSALPLGLPKRFWVLMACCLLLAGRIFVAMTRWQPKSRLPMLQAIHSDGASASVSFMLTFPIFLIIVSIIVQLGLIANAAVVMHYASFAAARSAAVWLPNADETGHDKAQHAAAVALAGISPAGNVTDFSEAATRALNGVNARPGARYAERCGYAENVTEVALDPPQFEKRLAWVPVMFEGEPMDFKADVSYQFLLTCPGAAAVLTSEVKTLGGVTGRFIELRGHGEMRSSPSRDELNYSSFLLRN